MLTAVFTVSAADSEDSSRLNLRRIGERMVVSVI
jgi:hypothetical protein